MYMYLCIYYVVAIISIISSSTTTAFVLKNCSREAIQKKRLTILPYKPASEQLLHINPGLRGLPPLMAENCYL